MFRVKYGLNTVGASLTGAEIAEFVRTYTERMAVLSSAISENVPVNDGGPNTSASLVISDRREAEAVLSFVSGLIGRVKGPSGKATFHICSHPDGGDGTYNCKDLQAQYTESTG